MQCKSRHQPPYEHPPTHLPGQCVQPRLQVPRAPAKCRERCLQGLQVTRMLSQLCARFLLQSIQLPPDSLRVCTIDETCDLI